MEKYRRRESLKDLAHELDLLFPHGYDGISNMDQGRRLRDEKIKDLRKTNGTLQEVGLSSMTNSDETFRNIIVTKGDM